MNYVHDITHCKGEKCSKRDKCYRYNAYKEIDGKNCAVSMFIFKEQPKNFFCFMKDDTK